MIRDLRGATLARVLAGMLGVSGCVAEQGPRLLAVTPGAAPREALVTLEGERLCGATDDCTRAAGEILIGFDPPQVRATVVRYDVDRAEIRIPSIAPIGATQLVVTVDDRTSNAIDFEVRP
ncbi:MAG: hypothetical protein H0T79_01995 [Deltaproteobacteria bacterium]|nr:hypothetical protein [Deltaproteobacteria bacterium]